MVTEVQYTNIKRVLDDLHDHPMLSSLTLEQAVRHVIRFIAKHGYSKLYQEKVGEVEIHEFRGVLPCDLISIRQVRDIHSGVCLRSMTDSFPKGMTPPPPKRECKDPLNNIRPWYIPKGHKHFEEPSFKTQGMVIFTSFPEGKVQISYKAIPVDEDGYPMLIDNETYLDALESYIKMKVFTVKYDQGDIAAGVMENAQKDYCAAARLLQSEMTLPTPNEMESIARMWNTMIPRVREFDRGFRDLGNREYLKGH